uniref:RING-type domain-containing protein n=1 Tax=Oryza barthii TaxID=65489 RepID=A0A0D3EM43_9ORYZ
MEIGGVLVSLLFAAFSLPCLLLLLVRELRCRHVFHRACLDAWLVLPRATCPLCRDCLLPPPCEPPRSFPLDYYDDDDDVHFGFNDFSITSSTTTTTSAAAAVAYPHGVALWPM